MRLELIKNYVDRLSLSTRDELVETLGKDNVLSRNEKNAVYLWLFPLLLKDRELPEKMKEVIGPSELMKPRDEEIVMLIGAYKSAQYGNFIRHLLHAFTDSSLVFPYCGETTEDCCICGKHLICHGSAHTRENLSYGSSESSVKLCLNCIIQLQALHQVLQFMEGEDYLNRYKR